MPTGKRALLSVSDKTGIVEFAGGLTALGFEIISTGGTAALLATAGLTVTKVADHTGFPEILSGRVKTLHPVIHGGILAQRDSEEHLSALEERQIKPIDLVCVNLYPFAKTVKSAACTLENAVENIDIGGPAMIRSAAKNWRFVAAVTDPVDYAAVLAAFSPKGNGTPAPAFLFNLAVKAFSHTAAYDGMISQYLSGQSPDTCSKIPPQLFPAVLNRQWQKVRDLRYGENPHQKAAFYQDVPVTAGGIAAARQLQGKELSYNNLADADAAWEAVKEFSAPACVIVKHANPCGIALGSDCAEAYQRAFATDKTSAFGGIVAFNREVSADLAAVMLAQQFMEVVLAPAFAPAAVAEFARKKNIRLLTADLTKEVNFYDFKRINGGILVQTPDINAAAATTLNVVSLRRPTTQQVQDLLFLWQVAKYVKSNAVVFGGEGRTYGIGAGQMSRVDATLIAARKARDGNFDLNGAAAASDAFFPFRDGVDVIAAQGIAAVIQPGGSIRDQEVIAAADEHNMVMIFTGERHFRH